MSEENKPIRDRVQKRSGKNRLINLCDKPSKKIIENMELKKYDQMFEERSQGYEMEEEIRSLLDKIRIRQKRIQTDIELKNSNQKLFEERRRFERKTTKISIMKKSSTLILPNLKQFMEDMKFQKEQDLLTASKRRKIMHLIIFSIHRYETQRYLEALDITLMACYYFKKNDHFNRLKDLAYSMIYKLNKLIQQQNKDGKRHLKAKKTKRNSLTVKKFISQQKFMENFIEHFRKSKLILECSYQETARNKNNKNKQRINAKCDVEIPAPEKFFHTSSIKNYDYVAVLVDNLTKSFPYAYPKSLQKHIQERIYRQIICKLNSFLYPQSKTYTFESIIKIFYLPFLIILLLLFSFTILTFLVVHIEEYVSNLIMLPIYTIALLFICILINIESNNYTNFIEIKLNMEKYFSQLETQFEDKNIKFRMASQGDAFFIVSPSQLQDKYTSENSNLTQIQEESQDVDQTLSKAFSSFNPNSENQTNSRHETETKIVSDCQSPNRQKNTHPPINVSKFSRLKAFKNNPNEEPKKQPQELRGDNEAEDKGQEKNNYQENNRGQDKDKGYNKGKDQDQALYQDKDQEQIQQRMNKQRIEVENQIINGKDGEENQLKISEAIQQKQLINKIDSEKSLENDDIQFL